MHIYQSAYKKPETILVKPNNTRKKNCRDIGCKNTKEGLEKYRLTEMDVTLKFSPQQTHLDQP